MFTKSYNLSKLKSDETSEKPVMES